VILMNEKNSESFYKEMKIINTRIILNKLIQLNLELYTAIIGYAKRNDISLPLDATILRLVEEIEETDIETFSPSLKPSRRIFTAKTNRRKLDRTLKSYIYLALILGELGRFAERS
jgi:hypothetical protein